MTQPTKATAPPHPSSDSDGEGSDHGQLLRFALAFVSSRAVAEEVVQDWNDHIDRAFVRRYVSELPDDAPHAP